MKVNIPKYFLGKPIEGSLERALASASQPPAEPQNPSVPTQAVNISDPGNYIILPGAKHGSYQYGELLVSAYRLGHSSDVEKASKTLGLSISNASQSQTGLGYIGNINWEQALKLNQSLGNITLNLLQFIDFRELLKSGIDGKKKVYDGNGKKMSTSFITSVYDEICEVRDPWRSEWLDAKFNSEPQTGSMFISYDHRLQSNGTLKPQVNMENLGNYIKEDGWIDESSFNNQGLPTKKSSKQKLYYWSPADGRVAGFGAGSVGAGLGCDRDPSITGSSLGVRAAREKI